MTTPTPDRPPLWRVMHNAFLSSTLSGEEGHQGFTQEIRAMRDWLVPEEEALADFAGWFRYRERQLLRAQLTAEAERAERGDG